jgi:cobalt/nickel transport system ATP-binding protein
VTGSPLFRLSGIGFGYDGQRQVHRELGLSLMPGERVALIGSNGSGKTTLFHLMVGLLRPQAGTIEAFGRPRQAEKDFREVRARAGLLFQDPDDQLFCPTVAEDVAFGPLNLGRTRAEATVITRDTLAALGLGGFEDRITYKLSGGEKRLVSLAAVLAMQPEALLLDEPTGGLDEATTARLVTILCALPQAMVIASHDHSFLEHVATRTLCLTDGRLQPV